MNNILNKLMLACVSVFSVLIRSNTVTATDSVVVGIVHREDYAYAKMMKNAFDMALEDVNNAGGVNGQPLQLTFSDDQGDPKVGEEGVKSLILEKKAVMLVGGYSSSNTLQMAYAANRLDKPFLVCTAANDRITQHNLKNICRLNPPASEYTKGLEEFLLDRVKPTSISIVYENSPYGTDGARRMMWFSRANDIEIKGEVVVFYCDPFGNIGSELLRLSRKGKKMRKLLSYPGLHLQRTPGRAVECVFYATLGFTCSSLILLLLL